MATGGTFREIRKSDFFWHTVILWFLSCYGLRSHLWSRDCYTQQENQFFYSLTTENQTLSFPTVKSQWGKENRPFQMDYLKSSCYLASVLVLPLSYTKCSGKHQGSERSTERRLSCHPQPSTVAMLCLVAFVILYIEERISVKQVRFRYNLVEEKAEFGRWSLEAQESSITSALSMKTNLTH